VSSNYNTDPICSESQQDLQQPFTSSISCWPWPGIPRRTHPQQKNKHTQRKTHRHVLYTINETSNYLIFFLVLVLSKTRSGQRGTLWKTNTIQKDIIYVDDKGHLQDDWSILHFSFSTDSSEAFQPAEKGASPQ